MCILFHLIFLSPFLFHLMMMMIMVVVVVMVVMQASKRTRPPKMRTLLFGRFVCANCTIEQIETLI